MKPTIPRRAAISLLGLLGACFLAGCGAADSAESDEPVAEAPQRQLDPGSKVQRHYTLTFPDGTQLATVYEFNQAIGSFGTTKEYWYVNKDSLSQVGTSTLAIAHTDSDSTTPPPDPGYTNEQSFTLTKNVSWGTGWSTDPCTEANCGLLHSGSDPSGASTFYLRIKVGSSGTVTRVTWYQVLPSSGTPANITPGGNFTAIGGSVSPGSGNLGYSISQKPNT